MPDINKTTLSDSQLRKLVEHCAESKLNGSDYTYIRKELSAQGLDKEIISDIIRAADAIVLKKVDESHPSGKWISTRLVAYGLIIFGTAITLLTYSGIIISSHFIFLYGPIIGGMVLLANERRKKMKDRRKNRGSPYDKWRRR